MAEQEIEGSHRRRRKAEKPRARKIGRILEQIAGVILCLLFVATPWMFATTEEWSMRIMNLGSYAAGAMILAAAICNRIAGARIEETTQSRVWKYVFLGLNLAVLAYCAVSLWNARATFSWEDRSFDYRENYNASLPTTYDAELTKETLLMLLAGFAAFWSVRYWLLMGDRTRGGEEVSALKNKRFQALMWVIAVNGFAIAVQGVLQRLSGSSELLWIRESWWKRAAACFGPFSYRGNAAEYLNLLWPIALGFWLLMSRERRRKMGSSRLFTDGPELLLIPITLVMIAASVVTLSRGGAAVAFGILVVIAVFFLLQRNVSKAKRIGVAVFFLMTVGTVTYLGSDALRKRYAAHGTDLTGRAEIYRTSKLIANDYPKFGTGAGSFRSVYHLYRAETKERWHGFLHDDWLETRVTLGNVGLAMVIAHLFILPLWFSSGGRPGAFYGFTVCAGLGIAGLLVHAKFDLPFQTYSIVYTFVVVCAVLSAVSPAKR
jgi:hypothetical protein